MSADTSVRALVFTMLAISIALVAVVAPSIFPTWAFKVSWGSEYVVDLGYQLNQGHTVLVSFFTYDDFHLQALNFLIILCEIS